jgi:hypothetical protein
MKTRAAANPTNRSTISSGNSQNISSPKNILGPISHALLSCESSTGVKTTAPTQIKWQGYMAGQSNVGPHSEKLRNPNCPPYMITFEELTDQCHLSLIGMTFIHYWT